MMITFKPIKINLFRSLVPLFPSVREPIKATAIHFHE